MSFAAIMFGVGSGTFFFLLWKYSQSQEKFLLNFALGIFLLYLFQVPFILANGGVRFVQSRFNIYFVLSFLANFCGFVIINSGLKSAFHIKKLKSVLLILAAWGLFCLLALFFHWFIAPTAVWERPYLFFYVLVLFVPIRLAVFTNLTAAWSKKYLKNNRPAFLSALVVQLSVLLNLLNFFLIIKIIVSYPPDLWFIAIVANKTALFWGGVASLLLVAGLFAVFRNSLQPKSQEYS